MHEYGLMQGVVERALAVCRDRGDRTASRVRIEVGEFAVATHESLETAYEALTQGTALQGSRLEIADVPGRARCEACGFQGAAADLGDELSEPPSLLLCPRCGYPLLVISGAGVALVDVQLTDRGRPDPTAPTCEGR